MGIESHFHQPSLGISKTSQAGGDGRDKQTPETGTSRFRNPAPHLDHRDYWSSGFLPPPVLLAGDLGNYVIFRGSGSAQGRNRDPLSPIHPTPYSYPQHCRVQQGRLPGKQGRRGEGPGRTAVLVAVPGAEGGVGLGLIAIEAGTQGHGHRPGDSQIEKGRGWGRGHFTVPIRLYLYIKVARGGEKPCPWGDRKDSFRRRRGYVQSTYPGKRNEQEG